MKKDIFKELYLSILILSTSAAPAYAQFNFCESPSDQSILDKVGKSEDSIKSYAKRISSASRASTTASQTPISETIAPSAGQMIAPREKFDAIAAMDSMLQNRNHIAGTLQRSESAANDAFQRSQEIAESARRSQSHSRAVAPEQSKQNSSERSATYDSCVTGDRHWRGRGQVIC